jgi:hypothetical protein
MWHRPALAPGDIDGRRSPSEDEATGQVCVASQLDRGCSPNVTLDGSATGVDCDDVVDLAGIGISGNTQMSG